MPDSAHDATDLDTQVSPGSPVFDSVPPAEPAPPSGTTIGGHFTVLDTLGRGGMGVVVRARDERLQRDVAIKLIHPKLLNAPHAYERFLTEARALAQVNHPGVVSIHAFASPEHAPYFVMEYVVGSDLQALIDARQFSTTEVLRVLSPLCEAVDAIHAAGFVHRDLKPRNILVGPGLRIVVTDLGLAHCLSNVKESDAHAPAGTPGYIAPELLLAGTRIRFPERIDVYAIGALTYRLLVGHGPHDADSDEKIVDSQLCTKPAPPSERNTLLPPAVDEVVVRALSIDPARRQGSAGEFFHEIRAALALKRRQTRQIVIADDDPDMRRWIELVVAEKLPNAKLHCVENGEQALNAVERQDPDLVITDLDMPTLDGVELTRVLRTRAPNLPVLVITAVGGAPEWQVLRELGANAFLPKPLDPELFSMTIERLLSAEPASKSPSAVTRGD